MERATGRYLSHRRFPDERRVLADALEEVLEVGHGGLLDALPQQGDRRAHRLAEPILAHARQVRVLKLLQGLQRGVVTATNRREARNSCSQSSERKVKY